MYKVLQRVSQKLSLLLDSWKKSIEFLHSTKTIKQFFHITIRALYQALSYAYIPIISLLILVILRLANPTMHLSGIYIYTTVILYILIIGLRSSKFMKNTRYFMTRSEGLLPLFCLVMISYFWATNITLLSVYNYLLFFVASPFVVFYIFFLLDAQWSFRAYVISLINSFYFCILNIPAILLAYIPAVIAIWSINILFTMLPVHTITAISKYVAILTVLVFYTAGLSSLYIKRRFDQFEYYYV